jgi:hypothetical protein
MGAAPGFCLPTDWSCVGSVTYPAPSAADAVVEISVNGEFAFSMPESNPVEGATVKACAVDDVDCSVPLDMQMTGADGLASLTVPTGAAGFDGYFEVTATSYGTTLLYAAAPITEASASVAVELLSDVAAVWPGVTLDAARGSLVAFVSPCATEISAPFPLGGSVSIASAEADAATQTGYIGFDHAYRFDTALTDTGFVAVAGMANHPAGTATLSFTNREPVQVAQRNVLVRADAVTFLQVAPTP